MLSNSARKSLLNGIVSIMQPLFSFVIHDFTLLYIHTHKLDRGYAEGGLLHPFRVRCNIKDIVSLCSAPKHSLSCISSSCSPAPYTYRHLTLMVSFSIFLLELLPRKVSQSLIPLAVKQPHTKDTTLVPSQLTREPFGFFRLSQREPAYVHKLYSFVSSRT